MISRLLLLLVALVTPLSALAQVTKPPVNAVAGPTTSAQLQSIITDATGSGALNFGPSAAASLTVGIPLLGGAPNGLLYNDANTLGNLATAANGVLITNGFQVPSISTTLPSGLTIPAPTINTSLTTGFGAWTMNSNIQLTRAIGTAPAGGANTFPWDYLVTFTANADGFSDVRATHHIIEADGTNDIARFYGYYNGVEVSTTAGTTDQIYNVHSFIRSNDAGEVTRANVYFGHLVLDGTGSIADGSAFSAGSSVFTSTGRMPLVKGFATADIGHTTLVDSAYAYFADDTRAAVAVYGYYSHVNDHGAEDAWQFYADGNADSLFYNTIIGRGGQLFLGGRTATDINFGVGAAELSVRAGDISAFASVKASQYIATNTHYYLGGTTATDIQLAKSGTTVLVRLGDASGFADVQLADITSTSAHINGLASISAITMSGNINVGNLTTANYLIGSSLGFNGVVARWDAAAFQTFETFENYGITASNQGISRDFWFGTGGVAGALGGTYEVITTDTWAAAGNRSTKIRARVIQAGVLGDAYSATSALFTVPAALSVGGALTYGGVTLTNAVTGTGKMVLDTNPTITGVTFSGAQSISSNSANAFDVGPNGTTNPVFQIDASTGSQAAGLKLTGAIAAGSVALAVISSGTDANLLINALGTGTIGIGSVSTGTVTITPALSGSTITTTGTVTVGTSATVNYLIGSSAGSFTGVIGRFDVAGFQTFETMRNYGVTATGQGIQRIYELGTGGSSGGTAGTYEIISTADWSVAGNRSAKVRVRVVQANSLANAFEATTTLMTLPGGVTLAGAITATSASSTAFTIGPNGATNPAFQISANTGSMVAGIQIVGAVTGGTVAINTIDSGSNTNVTFNAKGTGTIGIGTVSTGVITLGAAVTLSNATLTFTNLATDATHTTRTVCQDTTSKILFFGSGAAGICLGTSSARFKTNILPETTGLAQIAQLNPVHFSYLKGYGDDGARVQKGFLAEDVAGVMPELVGYDEQGRPNTVDWAGLVPVLVNAVKDLKASNDNLRVEVEALKRASR